MTLAEKFATPPKLEDVEVAFPATVAHLMPAYDEIPDDFKRDRNAWSVWQSHWFFSGLKSFPEAREGIDALDARRALSAIQGSFEPKHEHKQAAVAYLASLWLKEPCK